MKKNLPVPEHTKAPISHKWLWWIGPPAAITIAYRMIPTPIRGLWNPKHNASSHLGLAAILAGGGWKAFLYFALPGKTIGDSWDGKVSMDFDNGPWFATASKMNMPGPADAWEKSIGTNPITPGEGW